MKTLYIIRHAKSSWEDTSLADVDRPLNERGERDATIMGKRLKEKRVTPDVILSSPANRALSTAKKIADIINYSQENIKIEKALYHADENQILQIVKTANDKHDAIVIFGHNPGLTDFVNELTGELIINIPTCGVVACTFNTNTWKEVDWRKGEVEFFDFPKNKK